MERSQQIAGAHATTSPSGDFIASIATGKLRICASHAPERLTEINLRVQAKDVTGLRWNDDSDYVAISSHRLIEVVDLQDDSHRIRLDNGSGGLGKFATADFIATDQLLVTWEFGKAKVWNLSNGRSTDLADVKTTCTGDRWRLRPIERNANTASTTAKATKATKATQTLASLSRSGTEDVLNLYLPSLQKTIATTKLSTIDAQSLSWSPDGRWLAVLDTPTASTSVHFFTPDGHLFRSYPSLSQEPGTLGLGIKAMCWASNSQVVGLSRFDGKVALLNTRTFMPVAVVEHHTVIDQVEGRQAPIWQEVVSASGERSYAPVSQPFSPPLSKLKASSEPAELGVAEACFSCDGAYLATRDERMLNTVWVWDAVTLSAHGVIIQHANVRRLHWHPFPPGALFLDGGEGIVYLFSATMPQEPPVVVADCSLPGSPLFSCLPSSSSDSNSLSAILATSKNFFQLLWPGGRPVHAGNEDPELQDGTDADNEGEDSLLEMLVGRTPLPPDSYTERVDMEVGTEERDGTVRMEDTFRGKQVSGGRSRGGSRGGDGGCISEAEDPFDDSQIF